VAFRGEHYHSVDDKGRVIIPLKFRNELGNSFVITRGLGGCLFIYREDEFREIEAKLMDQPILDQHTLKLKRWLFASALDSQVDSQGRVAIPQNLRDLAGIKEDVVIAGTGEKIEIWSRDGWDALNASLTDEAIMISAVETGLGKSL
jgi:MraZ protein